MVLIIWVYVANDMYFVNPMLNIWGYKSFHITYTQVKNPPTAADAEQPLFEIRVFSREQLLDSIWGFDFTGDIRTVDSHVARLRTKLGAWGTKHLKTVYGIGYKIEDM
jgi:hypothetical protein